ncbi:sensor histidine kinase [Planomonospora parontospora]|uniref:sensor histidine kinase n=1 Tax=Planomonospora parontospora TaxID=58119 RepID=UPI0019B1EBAC|nr:sensor histidine kinase [Planomonospora parontospora]GGL49598.1 two-component sensor histidine kinase [Planomonospora parontospora subsp. antibiotica]GII15168.1 two-component sensor histidine kinase [Planomonospora parontospora subsp. antibiotica]
MLAALRSLWNEPRPPDPPPWTWRDPALVGVLVPAAVLEGFLRPDLPWRVVSVAVAVGLVPTLLWRRTRPLLVIVICFAVTGLVPLLTGGPPSEMYTMAYQLILPYALFRWGSGREAAIGLAIMVVSASLSVVTGRTAGADAIGAFTFLSATVALGGAFRYRSRARSRELDQVKLLEREQLARDLHDTVAHHVSAMAVRAQAGLATAESRPEAATEALRVIEAEAARALDEMHALVRVLRRDRLDEPVDLAPGRRIADIGRLAGRSRSGPAVDVEISGDLGGLPPSVEAAVYRLAQESVTNAVRHARHATRVEVRVTADDTSVRLRVSDDGDGGLVRPAASPGYGIIGMIERAHLLRGTCTAGPGPDRGWTVSAVLPRTGAAT